MLTRLPGCVLLAALAWSRAGAGPPQAGGGDGMPRDPVVYMTHGEYGDNLGRQLVVLGDVDGDGVPDFASTREAPEPGDGLQPRIPGQVDLFSGKTGKLVRSFRGEPGTKFFGQRGINAFPDLDGDGALELGASVPRVGTRVFSPASGETWYTIRDSGPVGEVDSRFLIIPDVDGDGTPDVAAGSVDRQLIPSLLEGGRVQGRSGRTGELLWTRWGTRYRGSLGGELHLSGDHDGDGAADILAPEVAYWPPGRDRLYETRTEIHVLSSAHGAVLRTYSQPDPKLFKFAFEVAVLGDRDGNGFPEIAVAAPFYRDADIVNYEPGDDYRHGGFFTGWIGVFALPEFELMFWTKGRESTTTESQAGDKLGVAMSSGGDVDGDGVLDFLAGTDRTTPIPFQQGRLYVFSGLNGDALATYEGYLHFDSPFFEFLSPLGDVDGDGRAEFLAGNTEENVHWNGKQLVAAGTVRALRYHTASPRYIRGDTNGDGRATLADVVAVAKLAVDRFCFSGDPLPPILPACPAAYDVDANGCIDKQDAIFLARYLFEPFRFAPAPPFPGCGQHYHLEVAEDLAFRHLPCLDAGICGK